MKNIVVLVSGGGTNLQALIDAEKSGIIKSGKITTVISSNPNAYALERAKNNNIDTDVIRRKDFDTFDEYDTALTELLKSKGADLVVLAGFMTILGHKVISAFENRIINTTIEKVRYKKEYKGFSIKKNRFMLWNIEGGEIKTIK